MNDITTGIKGVYFSEKTDIEKIAQKVESLFLSYLIKELKICNRGEESTFMNILSPIIEMQFTEAVFKNYKTGIKKLIIKDLDKLYR